MNLNLVFRGCRKTIKEIDPGLLFCVKEGAVSIDDIFMKCDPTGIDLGNNDFAVHLSTGQIVQFDEDKEVYKFPYTININVLVSSE